MLFLLIIGHIHIFIPFIHGHVWLCLHMYIHIDACMEPSRIYLYSYVGNAEALLCHVCATEKRQGKQIVVYRVHLFVFPLCAFPVCIPYVLIMPGFDYICTT